MIVVSNDDSDEKSYVDIEDRDALIFPYDKGVLVELVAVGDFEDTGRPFLPALPRSGR